MAEARITSKGQITVPKEIRERLGVGPGDALEFAFDGDRLEVRSKRRRSVGEFRGLFRVDEARPPDEEHLAAWDAITARLVARP